MTGGSATDAATYLREVAAEMRQLADQAPHGRWKWIVGDNPARWQLVTNDTLVDIATCTEDPDCPPVIAEHIASWDPDVARAVADLLDDTATVWEKRGWGYDRSPIPPDNKVLALARAYRREVTS